MKTLRKIIRCIIVFAVLFVIIGAFGSKLNTLFMEHHTYSEWWFWLLVIIAGIFAYVWVMQDSSGNESDTPKRKVEITEENIQIVIEHGNSFIRIVGTQMISRKHSNYSKVVISVTLIMVIT